MKTVPCPSAGSAVTVPPCSRAISRTSASPRPTPPISRLLDLSTRKKGWNTLVRYSSGMPQPCLQHAVQRCFSFAGCDMHRTAGGIVFDAVFNQIKEQAVDQGVAALDADILTFLKEGDAPALCQRGQVSHDLTSGATGPARYGPRAGSTADRSFPAVCGQGLLGGTPDPSESGAGRWSRSSASGVLQRTFPALPA